MSSINIHIQNLVKLFNKGDITKLYEKMYNLAETLSIHEMKRHTDLIVQKLDIKETPRDYTNQYFEKIIKYRDRRQKYHYEEMKKLLKWHLENKKNDTTN